MSSTNQKNKTCGQGNITCSSGQKIKQVQTDVNSCHRFMVMSGSMMPLINIGERIVVAADKPKNIRIGDVVLFKSGQLLVVHRIIGKRHRSGSVLYRQKGDASLHSELIQLEQIIGKVVAIEKKGKRYDLNQPRWRVVALVIGSTMAVLDACFRTALYVRQRLFKAGSSNPVVRLLRRIFERTQKLILWLLFIDRKQGTNAEDFWTSEIAAKFVED